MPRIQTLIVVASAATRKNPVRRSKGPRARRQQRAGRQPDRPARRTAHEAHARRDLLGSPPRARDRRRPGGPSRDRAASARSGRVSPAALNAYGVPAGRRPQVAEHARRAVGAARPLTCTSGEPTGARAVTSTTCWLGCDDERRRLERRVVAQRRVVAAGPARVHRHAPGPISHQPARPVGEARRGRPRGRGGEREQAGARRPPRGVGRRRSGARVAASERPAGGPRRRTTRRRRAGTSGGAVPWWAS